MLASTNPGLYTRFTAARKTLRQQLARRQHGAFTLTRHNTPFDFPRPGSVRTVSRLAYHGVPARRAFDAGHLGHIVRHGHTDTPERLEPFREWIDEGALLPVMFIEQ